MFSLGANSICIVCLVLTMRSTGSSKPSVFNFERVLFWPSDDGEVVEFANRDRNIMLSSILQDIDDGVTHNFVYCCV